jgi:hypothetical protein
VTTPLVEDIDARLRTLEDEDLPARMARLEELYIGPDELDRIRRARPTCGHLPVFRTGATCGRPQGHHGPHNHGGPT